jgi:hypothetical protein
MKNPCLLLLALMLSGTLFPQAADIPINANATFNGEQSLAIHPNNPAHMVVAWMKYHLFPAPAGMVIATSSSTNGGLSWSAPLELPHFRAHWVSADPTLAFKSDGSLYLGYIDYKSNHDSGAVYVVKSLNGGVSWGTPNKVIDKYDNADLAIDRPWLCVDNSGGTFNGSLYMVTKSIKDDPLPHHIYLMRSVNDGVSWSAPLLVDDVISSGPTLKSMGVPAVTSSGKLVIAYAFYTPPSLPGFAAAISTDGGATLSNSVIVTQTVGNSTNDTLLQGSYNLAAQPTSSSNLVLVLTHKTNTDFDVSRVYSNDAALTWSPAQRICSDPAGNGNNQDMVWAGFSSTGKYAAVWRDRRANSGAQDQAYKIWGAYSTDGGNNFSGNFQLSQSDGPLMVPVDGNDFLGCALNDTVVYSCWTDKRNNSSNQLFMNKYRMPFTTSVKAAGLTEDSHVIFPNPNTGNFTITFRNKDEKIIEILDVTGKLIYSSKTSQEKLEVKLNEAKGHYLVKITEGEDVKTRKMVVE